MAGVEDERVSIVVMSRDRRPELLSSLPRHAAHVVLVDNASGDGTAEAVTTELPEVDVVRLRRNVGAYARTIGVRRVASRYVAFADDDSWWEPGALHAAVDWLEAHPQVAVVQVRVLVGPDDLLDPFCVTARSSALPRPTGVDRPVLMGFMACAAVVRRDQFLAAGGFDDVVRFPGEEERLALDLAAQGLAIAYLDEVVVHHHPSPSRSDPDGRRAAVVRSAVLTGVMRLPWSAVALRVRAAWSAGPAGRRGLVRAVTDLPRALRARRVVPSHVLALLALLDDARPATAPRSADGELAQRARTDRSG
jgi:GT2 family glycosyltransferase